MIDQRQIQEIRDRLDKFRQRLPVDQFQLELACMDQPVIYDEVGQLVTEWNALAKIADDKLNFVKADQSSKVRLNPEKFGVAKLTEGSVESAVLLTKEHQEAASDLIETEKIVGYLRILQLSLDQRKSTLNNLVTLWVHSYYSKQNEMGTERKAVGEITEKQIIEARIRNAARRNERDERDEEEAKT
jgi:hypothetical protein